MVSNYLSYILNTSDVICHIYYRQPREAVREGNYRQPRNAVKEGHCRQPRNAVRDVVGT